MQRGTQGEEMGEDKQKTSYNYYDSETKKRDAISFSCKHNICCLQLLLQTRNIHRHMQ